MMKDIENTFVYTKQIHDEYMKCIFWRSPKLVICFYLFIACFLLAIFRSIGPHPDPTAGSLFTLAVVGMLVYFFLYTSSKKGYASLLRRSQGEVTFHVLLSDNRISLVETSNAAHRTVKYEYADIDRAFRTKNLIIILFGHGASCILLKSGFAESSAEEALQLLKSHNVPC